MDSLKTKILEEHILYDGSQLSSHWIYNNTDLIGDAVVCFIGPADVKLDKMVDLTDRKRKEPIKSSKMLHFIGEWFIDSFETGIVLQYFFISTAFEVLSEFNSGNLQRKGNDLFYKSRKLSVSISTVSPISVLMHTGFNIDTEGTPIPTAGLSEIGIEPINFCEKLLQRFKNDIDSMRLSRVKVTPRY